MDNKIEEVKKILDQHYGESPDGMGNLYIAKRICQLFEPKPLSQMTPREKVMAGIKACKPKMKVYLADYATGKILNTIDEPKPDAEISFKMGYETAGEELGKCYAPTFKDGKKAGIREVVESVQQLWKPQHHNLCYGIIDPHPDCICCKWQAKLKSWGIDGLL